jgi:hypothetical protein
VDNLQARHFLTTAVGSIFQKTFIMVSSRLLQAGIVIAAFFIMVSVFQALAVSLIFFFVAIFNNHGNIPGEYYQTMIMYAILFLAALFIVRKSTDIATWMSNKSSMSAGIRIRLSYSNVFAIILVAYSVFQLINKIPKILIALVRGFRSEVAGDRGLLSGFGEPGTQSMDWLQVTIEIVMYVSIIYAAKPIAGWFSNWFETEDDNFSFEDNSPAKEVPQTRNEP